MLDAVRDTDERLGGSASFLMVASFYVSCLFSVSDLKQHKLSYRSTDPGSALALHHWLPVYHMTQLHHHQELLLHLYKFDFKSCLIISDRDQFEAVVSKSVFFSFLSEYVTLRESV